MDMNDILNQWENYQKNQNKKQNQDNKNKISSKKANALTLEEKIAKSEKDFEEKMKIDNEKKINPMELWLFCYGTIDKDKIAEEAEERQNQNDRNYILNMKAQAKIDLHGLHQDEAEKALDVFITNSLRKGLKKIMIVHGKGNHTHGTDPVLGELVRKFIENDKRCGASGHPKQKSEGGSGATWVILKK